MAFCGQWRAEPTWLDRSGRFLGAAWIALAMIDWYVIVRSWLF
jgi:hypothetical protein